MMYLAVLVSLVALFIGLCYYITRNDNYFKKHGIVHIPPKPLIGNLGPLFMKQCSMHDIVSRIYNLHPDAKYVGMYEFFNPIILLRDLDLIKTVTIKNWEHFMDHKQIVNRKMDPLLGGMLFSLQGDEWKEKRNMVSPTFTSSKIKYMFKLMANCAARFADDLTKLPEVERDTDMKQLLNKYTNDTIASCVYGISLDTMKDPNNVFYVYGKKATNLFGFWKSLILLLHRNIPKLALILRLRFIKSYLSDFFETLAKDTLKSREESGIHRPDMVQLMIDIRNKKEGRELTPDEIAHHAFSFFFGGFDSVSSQSSFVCQMLVENPDVQARLQAEIDEALEKNDGNLSYEVIQEMKYLDAVVNETLRCYPIVTFLDRTCVKDFELPPALPGDKPYTMKKGMNLWIPISVIHRDPRYYENPDKFDPDRFLKDGKRIMNSGIFAPFGLGPRMCIGNRFALTMMKVVICHLLARCSLTAGKKTVIPLQLDKGVVNFSLQNGFWLKLQLRQNPHLSVSVNGEANRVC